MITFRPLGRSDLNVIRRWLNTPHVYEWWGRHVGPGALGGAGENRATEAQVEAKYGPDLDHGGVTHRFIILFESSAVGLIQWYHLRDFPDYARAIGEDAAVSAGMDLFVGEPSAIGRGLGSRAIDAFVTSIVFRQDDVKCIVTGPAKTNIRSIRAFEKAGFRTVRFATVDGEPIPEAVMVRNRT